MRHLIGIYIKGKLWRKVILNDFAGFTEGRQIIIGRLEKSDICVPMPIVSRKHAVIECVNGIITITDAGSLNKLRVKGKVYNKIRLASGMQIVIGTDVKNEDAVVLMYVAEEERNEDGAPVQTVKGEENFQKAAPNIKQEDKNLNEGRSTGAGVLGRRLLAFMADMVICMFMCIGGCGGMVLIFKISGVVKLAMILFVLFIFWLYFSLSESGAGGGTMGKLMLGLSVVDKRGGSPSFGTATKRIIAKIPAAFTLYLPIFGKGRCLHDLIAGTRVVYKGK
ncbi:MAG: RDD family protein [Bacillota bacterium]|nr:RDD family protein [Bacillota bacterium]